MQAGYLYADVEGSTPRWERDARAMSGAMARRAALVEACVIRHGGRIHDCVGDSIFALFESGGVLQCALDIQRAMQAEDFSEVGGLALRIGVHAGPLEIGGGPNPVFSNRVARIAACGWGGQIVLSSNAREAFAPPLESSFSDLGVVRLRGIFSPVRLYELTSRALPHPPFPPPRVGALQASPLPTRRGPLFGRDRELADICAAFETQSVRHLTIVGAAGNGKTCLALEVARALSEQKGVIFTTLDPAQRGEGLAAAMSRALEFPARRFVPQEQQLLEFLRDKEALVVIDNAEAVASTDRCIDRLLDTCPGVSVLAAGRAPINGVHEVLYPLAGLKCGDDVAPSISDSGAYCLFAYEARRVGADSGLDEASAIAFAEICKRISGSPLALQMTARWRRLLSLEAILSRLETDVDFLSGIAADPSNGLRAVFESSLGLLSDEAQLLLMRLSVFHGGFEGPDAENVADCKISALADLELRGLIQNVGAQRFALHPIVRQYARERLDANAAEALECRTRHARKYLDLMTARDDERLSALVLDDYANLRAAWTFAVQHDTATAWRAIEPLFYALATRSKFQECSDLFSSSSTDCDLDHHCAALRANGLAHVGDLVSARELAVSLEQSAQRPLTRAHLHQALGNIDHAEGKYAEALVHYQAARDLRVASGDNSGGLIYTYISMAALRMLEKDTAGARSNFELAHRAYVQAGVRTFAPHIHCSAGDIAMLEGRADDAYACINEALACNEAGPQQLCNSFVRLAQALSAQGEQDGARKRLTDAIEIARAAGDLRGKLLAHLELARVEKRSGNFDAAKRTLLQICRDALKFGAAPILKATLLELIEVERALGNEDEAQRLNDTVETAAPAESAPVQMLKRAVEEHLLSVERQRLRL